MHAIVCVAGFFPDVYWRIAGETGAVTRQKNQKQNTETT